MGDKQPACVSTISIEINELKEMIKGQNKRIDNLIKKMDDGCKQEEPRESTMENMNPYLECLNPDVLFHLNLSTATTDFEKVFGDVLFVVLGESDHAVKEFAEFIMKEIGISMNSGVQLKNISEGHFYSMYKVGPILCASHCFGGPSIGILLHEIIKIMHYAKCQNPIFFRMGTCQGVGVEPGTVVITTETLDAQLRPSFDVVIKTIPCQREVILNKELVNELMGLTDSCADGFTTVSGRTLCVDDYYEGTLRMDGAFCEYTPQIRRDYIGKLICDNIISIEMESTAFAAFTRKAGIRAAVLCVALNDRKSVDGEIHPCPCEVKEWNVRPATLIARYIRKALYGDEEKNEGPCECSV